MRIDADLRLSVHRANRSLTSALRCRADKLRPALERRRKVGPRGRPDRIERGARLVQRRALMREHRQLPLAHAVDVGPRARVAFDRALRVLRSRRFGHRDAVFLYGRLETRSEEHTSELQSLMRISYAVFCLNKKKNQQLHHTYI